MTLEDRDITMFHDFYESILKNSTLVFAILSLVGFINFEINLCPMWQISKKKNRLVIAQFGFGMRKLALNETMSNEQKTKSCKLSY